MEEPINISLSVVMTGIALSMLNVILSTLITKVYTPKKLESTKFF